MRPNVPLQFMDMVKVEGGPSLAGGDLSDPVGKFFEQAMAKQAGVVSTVEDCNWDSQLGMPIAKQASRRGALLIEETVIDGTRMVIGYDDQGEVVRSKVL